MWWIFLHWTNYAFYFTSLLFDPHLVHFHLVLFLPNLTKAKLNKLTNLEIMKGFQFASSPLLNFICINSFYESQDDSWQLTREPVCPTSSPYITMSSWIWLLLFRAWLHKLAPDSTLAVSYDIWLWTVNWIRMEGVSVALHWMPEFVMRKE